MGFLKFSFVTILLCFALWMPQTTFAVQESGKEDTSVCISCHLELGGEMAEPVTLWKESIHHQMGNKCEGCHGGDPSDAEEAMSPEKGFVGSPKEDQVASFCGKCHVGVKENYMKSVHYTTSLEGIGPTCITCHKSHDVKKASFDLVNEELCSQCHSYENGRKIKKAMVNAELGLKDYKKKVGYFGKRGMPVKRLEEKLFSLRNSLHQMTHTLNLVEIQKKTGSVLQDLQGMNLEMESFQKRIHKRWWIGAGVVVFLSILIFVLIKLLRTYEEE